MQVSWDQVFTWRLARQYISDPTSAQVPVIVERLCGVQTQVGSAAEAAVALRRKTPKSGALSQALSKGTLFKTWAMRGTLHALTPESAAAFLPLMAATRIWEKPSWQKTFGATPAEVEALTAAVSQILENKALTRDELVEALLADKAFHKMGEELKSGWGALLKPLAWQGALCHGAAQGNRVTFTTPAKLIAGWKSLPEPDAAAPAAVTAYLGAYGPATPDAFDGWLSRNNNRKPAVRGWFSDLGDALTQVDIEGTKAYIRAEHADELAAVQPQKSVHFLGAFDQYVLGPGTKDTELLPAAHRSDVSRTAGWIAPLVVVDGRIAGTWERDGGNLVVSMFDGAKPPAKKLDAAASRVAAALGIDVVKVVSA
ncbi:winged helix DNA-binding domain-containing protein [Nocardia sp. XZ_19_385]|uniref:winged helix DNA-binding domain-containing protein n=1 Tax=Nocardia sp. XZ_19_385 TaxID=2769488 RepID=UPI0018905BC5|nr:winged helix DNA-binding domain-containing protein [Nocardia sp. XZ_19_385]